MLLIHLMEEESMIIIHPLVKFLCSICGFFSEILSICRPIHQSSRGWDFYGEIVYCEIRVRAECLRLGCEGGVDDHSKDLDGRDQILSGNVLFPKGKRKCIIRSIIFNFKENISNFTYSKSHNISYFWYDKKDKLSILKNWQFFPLRLWQKLEKRQTDKSKKFTREIYARVWKWKRRPTRVKVKVALWFLKSPAYVRVTSVPFRAIHFRVIPDTS